MRKILIFILILFLASAVAAEVRDEATVDSIEYSPDKRFFEIGESLNAEITVEMEETKFEGEEEDLHVALRGYCENLWNEFDVNKGFIRSIDKESDYITTGDLGDSETDTVNIELEFNDRVTECDVSSVEDVPLVVIPVVLDHPPSEPYALDLLDQMPGEADAGKWGKTVEVIEDVDVERIVEENLAVLIEYDGNFEGTIDNEEKNSAADSSDLSDPQKEAVRDVYMSNENYFEKVKLENLDDFNVAEYGNEENKIDRSGLESAREDFLNEEISLDRMKAVIIKWRDEIEVQSLEGEEADLNCQADVLQKNFLNQRPETTCTVETEAEASLIQTVSWDITTQGNQENIGEMIDKDDMEAKYRTPESLDGERTVRVNYQANGNELVAHDQINLRKGENPENPTATLEKEGSSIRANAEIVLPDDNSHPGVETEVGDSELNITVPPERGYAEIPVGDSPIISTYNIEKAVGEELEQGTYEVNFTVYPGAARENPETIIQEFEIEGPEVELNCNPETLSETGQEVECEAELRRMPGEISVENPEQVWNLEGSGDLSANSVASARYTAPGSLDGQTKTISYEITTATGETLTDSTTIEVDTEQPEPEEGQIEMQDIRYQTTAGFTEEVFSMNLANTGEETTTSFRFTVDSSYSPEENSFTEEEEILQREETTDSNGNIQSTESGNLIAEPENSVNYKESECLAGKLEWNDKTAIRTVKTAEGAIIGCENTAPRSPEIGDPENGGWRVLKPAESLSRRRFRERCGENTIAFGADGGTLVPQPMDRDGYLDPGTYFVKTGERCNVNYNSVEAETGQDMEEGFQFVDTSQEITLQSSECGEKTVAFDNEGEVDRIDIEDMQNSEMTLEPGKYLLYTENECTAQTV